MPVLAALAADVGHRGVDEVVLGNCCGPGGDVARVAALGAGLGTGVTGVTVDRQCGSGLEAIRLAAALVRAGDAGLVLAGGTESASTARNGGVQVPFTPPGFPDPAMGAAAGDLAAAPGVDRGRPGADAPRPPPPARPAAGA